MPEEDDGEVSPGPPRPARMRVRLASLCAGQRGAGAFVRANSHRLATGPPPSPATLLPAATAAVEGWENASGARGAWLLMGGE